MISKFKQDMQTRLLAHPFLLYFSLILFGVIVFLIISLIPVFTYFSKKHGDGYWNNYWNTVPVVIAAIPAILAYFLDKHEKDIQDRHNKFIKIQHEISDSIIPKIAMFDKKIRDKVSDIDLINALIYLLYEFNIFDTQFSLISNKDDADITDSKGDIEQSLKKILSDPDNENIVNVVTSITPHLLGQVTELKDNVLLDSGPELSYLVVESF